MKWVKRALFTVIILVAAVIGIGVVATMLEEEKPVATMAAGDSKVLIYGRFDSVSTTKVDGGSLVTLNGRHRVQLVSSGDLTVNDVPQGRGFSTAEIRLKPDGTVATVVNRESR